MHIEAAAATGQGARDYNEDRYGHWSAGRYALWIVADGAGGHGGGDVAAQIVCDTVVSAFSHGPSIEAQALRAMVLDANDRILARHAEGGRLAHMRSTVVMAAFDLAARRMVWVHSGDSRAYLFRRQTIAARTSDHSLVQQMVASGMVDEETARAHPQRSVLLSALGAPAEQIEITVSDPMRVQPGDDVLLCSDGIWEVLGDARLTDSLEGCGSSRQWAQQVQAAVLQAEKPAQDNFTGLFLRVQDDAAQETQIVLPQSD